MKKTVTINISGIFFHIDEDAYEKLNAYFDKINLNLSQSEGRSEIIADIESRIAEMLQAKINQNKQVVTIEDVDEVISIMGNPEQIGGVEDDGKSGESKWQEPSKHKRLYRDSENKVLGGVCAGLAAYFNIDVVWIRVAFVIAMFFGGTGPLLYILLWVIIPEASTTAEKLEMRGEPITISNIEKSFNEEIDGLKKRLKNLKNEAKSKDFKINKQMQSAVTKSAGVLVTLVEVFARCVMIFVGVMFVIVGVSLLISLPIAFYSSFDIFDSSNLGLSSCSVVDILKASVFNGSQITLLMVGFAIVCGVPLVSLIYNGVKLIFNIKYRNRYVRILMLSIWIIGLIVCFVVGLTVVKDFSSKAVVVDKTILKNPVNDVLKVYAGKGSCGDSMHGCCNMIVFDKMKLVQIDDDRIVRCGIPNFEVKRSEGDYYQLLIYVSSRGSSKVDAGNRVKKIVCNYVQNDTALIIDPYFMLSDHEKWRNQNVKIVLKVPEGKSIYLSSEISRMMHLFDDESCEYTDELEGKTSLMTDDGLRECIVVPVKADSLKLQPVKGVKSR